VDPDGLTAVCATRAEERAGRRGGLRPVRVGLGAADGLPDGELVSYGLAGALDGLQTGAVVDAVRVVDEAGATLWEGGGLGVPGAVHGTVLAAERLVDDSAERRRLHTATGADVVDLESGVLARSGRLRGCLRVVSDTPARPLGRLANAVSPRGGYDWASIGAAFARSPRASVRVARDARKALETLSAATRRWSRA
jgi:hypothetical protein